MINAVKVKSAGKSIAGGGKNLSKKLFGREITAKELKLKVKRGAGATLFGFLRYALIICLSFLILLPILERISTAFKSPYELGLPVSKWIPGEFSIEHIVMAFKVLRYEKTLPFTLLTTAILMILQTLSAAMAGYTFARLKFKGSGLLFGCVLLTIIVPPQALMLPQYVFFQNFDIFGLISLFNGGRGLNLLNSSFTLYILSFFGMGLKSGLYIYIFRQCFRGLPKELEEAAFVDGAGFIRTFAAIVMPAAKSSIITVAVLSFVWNWNDTYFVKLFNPSGNNIMMRFSVASAKMDQALNAIHSSTVPADFALLNQNPLYQTAVTQTATLLIMLPLIIGYLIVQKQFVAGAERSGIVG